MSKLIIFNLKTPDQKKLKFFLYFLVMSMLITLSPQLITSAENIFYITADHYCYLSFLNYFLNPFLKLFFEVIF